MFNMHFLPVQLLYTTAHINEHLLLFFVYSFDLNSSSFRANGEEMLRTTLPGVFAKEHIMYWIQNGTSLGRSDRLQVGTQGVFATSLQYGDVKFCTVNLWWISE